MCKVRRCLYPLTPLDESWWHTGLVCSPSASRGAGEGPCRAGHPLLWGRGGSGQPARSQRGRRWREGILGSREERAQYDPEQKAFELAERAPESEGTMSGREICL